MATVKKAAPAKKAAPRKAAPKKVAAPKQEAPQVNVEHHFSPLSEAPQFIQDLFRPAGSKTVCDCPKSKTEKILDILKGLPPREVREILEDVRTTVRRDAEDEATALRRALNELEQAGL